MKIIGIGEIVWDCFPEGRRLGGAPVNFCFFAKELGAEAYPITAIGSDELGDETFAELEKTGLDLSYVSRNTLPTGRVLVRLDAAGVPRYDIVEQVAWDAIEPGRAALQLAKEADAVCWGSLALRSAESRSSILKIVDAVPDTSLKVFDINIRQHFYSKDLIVESLQKANILKLNEDELPLLITLFSLPSDYGEAISTLVEHFSLQYVIFTQGALRSGIYAPGGIVSSIDTPKVEVVDTVGAGDSFTAAFVVKLLGGDTVADAHHQAVAISAYTCTQRGAINPLPERMKAITGCMANIRLNGES